MPRLCSSPMPQPNSAPTARKRLRRVSRAIMRSYHIQIPKYDFPIRLRPWFLVFTVLVMMTLAFLGFTNFSRSLPLNDKLLHFLCFLLATVVFYFIFDVEEDARRIWFWRYGNLIFTGVTTMFFGGIMSEVVQSLLPYKEFQFGDVVANLLGSSIGIYTAYHLEKYYRHRREINRLYRPLAVDEALSDPEDDDDDTFGSFLPTHYIPPLASAYGQAASPTAGTHDQGRLGKDPSSPLTKSQGQGHTRAPSQLANVWDEGDELFGIGDDEDEGVEDGQRTPVPPPKIVVNPADE